MKRFLITLAVVGCLCGSGLSSNAWAAAKKKEPKTPAEKFKKLDKDGDGFLTAADFVGKKTGYEADKATARFKKMDKDNDGKLTEAEYTAAAETKKKKDK